MQFSSCLKMKLIVFFPRHDGGFQAHSLKKYFAIVIIMMTAQGMNTSVRAEPTRTDLCACLNPNFTSVETQAQGDTRGSQKYLKIVWTEAKKQTDNAGIDELQLTAIFLYEDSNDKLNIKTKIHTYEVFMQTLSYKGFPIGKWSWFYPDGKVENKDFFNYTKEVYEKCNKPHGRDENAMRPVDLVRGQSYDSPPCKNFLSANFPYGDTLQLETETPTMFHYSAVYSEPRVKFCARWKHTIKYIRGKTSKSSMPPIFPKLLNIDFIFQMNWEEDPNIESILEYNKKYKEIKRDTAYVHKLTIKFEENGNNFKEVVLKDKKRGLNDKYRELAYEKDKNNNKCTINGISISPPAKLQSYSYLLFHPEIQPIQRKQFNDPSGRIGTTYGDCFSLVAYPLPSPDDDTKEVHVSFRQYPTDPTNLKCKNLRATEITMQVYTDTDFPVGRANDSWRISDVTTDKENHCTGENSNLAHLQPGLHYKTFKAISDNTIRHKDESANNTFWRQEDVYPTMLWARFQDKEEIGLCATWSYNSTGNYTLEALRFIAEILVYEKGKPTVVALVEELVYKENITIPKATTPNCTADISGNTDCHTFRASSTLCRRQDYNITKPEPRVHSLYYRACIHKQAVAIYNDALSEYENGCIVPFFKGVPPTLAPNEYDHITFPNIPVRQIDTVSDDLKKLQNTFYSGCGDTKACITSKKSCIQSRSCELAIAYGGPEEPDNLKQSNEIVVELFGNTPKWVAMGISTDEKMSEDYVVECCHERDKINIYNSWNIKADDRNSKKNVRQVLKQGNGTGVENVARLAKSSSKDSNIYCKFYIKGSFSRKPKDQDKTFDYNLFKTSYYILMAGGDLLKSGETGNVAIHDPGKTLVSERKVKLGKRYSPEVSQRKSLQVHGQILLLAWFIFLPIGMFVGRYMKETNRNYVIFNVEVWKFVHIACMSIGYMLILISLICHIYGRYGWTQTTDNRFHTIMGWVIECSVVIIMITGGILAKDIGDEGFDCIQFFHDFLGHFVYISGLFMIYFSPTHLKYSAITCSLSHWTIAWLVIYLIMQIPISLHYCWLDYLYCNGWAGISSSVFVFKTLTFKNTTESDAPGAIVRIIMTLVFTIVTVIIGLSIILIAFYASPCRPVTSSA